MKRIFTILISFAMIAFMCSCGKSKADVILDGFEDLVEDVEKKKGDMTIEEWAEIENDFNRRFEELGIEEFDESEFSVMQKMELMALTLRWTAAMAESAPELMESAIEQIDKDQQ